MASPGSHKGPGKPEAVEDGRQMKTSHGLLIAAAIAVVGVTGCTTKNYVKSQTAPIIDHTNQLEQKTAITTAHCTRWTSAQRRASNKLSALPIPRRQNAQNATKAAGDADTAANDAVHRADSLDSVVKGLDNYKSMANVTVTFGFDKAVSDQGRQGTARQLLRRSLEARRATFWKLQAERTRSAPPSTTMT